jgi:magnesium chelatase family protein
MARLVQAERYKSPTMTNAGCPARLVHETAKLTPDARELLSEAIDRYRLSARGVVRSIRVARTIADLAQSSDIAPDHMQSALGYRMFDLQPVTA